jgi:putative membrane protein
MDWTILPSVNAGLNGLSAVLLLLGFRAIRRGDRAAHKRLMLGAVATSVLFLASYLTYHAQVGSVRFTGEGPVRILYFGILLTHTFLAAAVPALASYLLIMAFAGRFDRHKAVARWALPLWLYVSVTGVVIYVMLYHLYPPQAR